LIEADRQKEIEHSIQWAKDWYAAGNAELMPMFHAFSPMGLIVVGTPWENEAAKVAVLSGVRVIFAAHRVRAYILLSETWQVPCNGDEEMKRFDEWRAKCPDRSFADYPGRIDCLSALYVSYKEKVITSFEMKRNDAGKIVDFVPLAGADTKLSGRMVELLPADGKVVSYHERLLAKKLMEKWGIPQPRKKR
jgi:hypothetical protein